jgi:hypothetical protein
MSNISVALPKYFGFCAEQDFCEEQEEGTTTHSGGAA